MLNNILHESNYLRYKVIFEEHPYKDFSSSATIHFFDENDKVASVLKLGVISEEEIFRRIENNEILNLNQAYISNFSLSEYRIKKGLNETEPVILNNFSAKKAFFDCELITDFSYADFSGETTNFEGCIFGNNAVTFANARFLGDDVIFKNSKFGTGSVSFQSVGMGKGLVCFNKVNFGKGNLNFVDANFGHGNVDFKNAIFGEGIVDFKFAKFLTGEISFERCNFSKGKKDFKNVEFGDGKIDFRRIEFNDGDVSFEGTEFGNGKINFRGSSFGDGFISFEQSHFGQSDVHFELVKFGTGSISFNKAQANNISFAGCSLNCYMDLRFKKCNLINLSNTILRDILDLMHEDEKVHINTLDLSGMRNLGKIFIHWRSNNVRSLIYNQTENSYFKKSEQFRILKENFRNNGQYDDEDKAYIQFKRCESKANLELGIERGGIEAIMGYINYYFQKYFFDFIGRYATDPTRVFINMLIAIITFGLGFYSLTNFFPEFGSIATTIGDSPLNHYNEFGNAFYFSAITFFTIGYGDYFAEGFMKPLAAFEGFTGVFLMSYFTVAFVRKTLR